MKKIILLVGPCGSGKSVYAKNLETQGYARISQDDQGKKEHLDLFHSLLTDGHETNIVVDRMNFSKEQRERYLAPARAAGYSTEIIVLHVSANTCRDRMAARRDHPTIHDEKTASKVLNFFFKSYERVQDSEADVVTRLGWDRDLPSCVVSDLDNTLCNTDHRQHLIQPKPGERKNWKAFFDGLVDDPVHEWCREIIYKFEFNYPIIFCSGRPDNYKPQTEEWLEKNKIEYDHLFMRPRNDFRSDDIAKEIILEFEIKTRHNILFWLDDRKQVIDRIRQHGVVVLDWAGEKGNF